MNQTENLTRQLVCGACFGKGFIIAEEPEEYSDDEGNSNIRFRKVQFPCPHCREGFPGQTSKNISEVLWLLLQQRKYG